jgi:hypothetical protein
MDPLVSMRNKIFGGSISSAYRMVPKELFGQEKLGTEASKAGSEAAKALPSRRRRATTMVRIIHFAHMPSGPFREGRRMNITNPFAALWKHMAGFFRTLPFSNF